MNNWTLAKVAIRLVLAAPFIYLTWWGFQMSSYTHQMQNVNEQALLGEGGISEIPAMPDSPFSFLTKGLDRKRSVSETGLNNNRVITVDEIMSIVDVLRDGEDIPDPAFHTLYMTARAPAHMIRYCEEALGTLAQRCGLLRTEAKPRKDGSFGVSARIAYAPTYTVGQTDIIGGEFVSTRVDLTPQERTDLPTRSGEQRAFYTAIALQACDALRDTYGSCVIEDMSFEDRTLRERELEKLPPGTDPVRMEVSARLAVFTIDTREERNVLEERASEIIAALN